MTERDKPRSRREEEKRAFLWKKTKKLALMLSHPGIEQPDGSVIKLTIDEALDRLSADGFGKIINRSAARWNAREALRRYIENLTASPSPSEIELLEEIKAQNPNRIRIEPKDLYKVFGIEPHKARKPSPFGRIQTGITPIASEFTGISSLPQPETDSERREISAREFLNHLRELNDTTGYEEHYIGKPVPPMSTPVSNTPREDSGTEIRLRSNI